MSKEYIVKEFKGEKESELKHFYSDCQLFEYIQENVDAEDGSKVKFTVYQLGECLLDLS